MGDAKRRGLKPKKIRVRSLEELQGTMIAYRNLYKADPFLANMMLLCSELSEYLPEIVMDDEKKLKVFIEKNLDGLLKQYLRRFKSVDECVIPPESLDSPIRIKGTDWIN